MSWHNKEKTLVAKKSKTFKEQTVEDVNDLPLLEGIPERGLTKATCHHFGLRREVDGVGLAIAHYFPVYYKGNLTGYAKRTLGIPKSRAWSVVGIVTPECEFLGMNEAKKDGTRTLLIVEGFYDVLAAHQMMMEHTADKYKPLINIVSLLQGTPNAVSNCVHNEDFISKHKSVLLAFDNDSVTVEEKKTNPKMMRGKEATQAVGARFSIAKKIPLVMNDPCDYLKAGKSKEFYNAVCFNQTIIEFAFLNRGVTLTAKDIKKPSPKGLMTGIFPLLDKILGGFRVHEFTMLMSIPKAGKTYVARAVAHAFLQNTEEIINYCSLEDNRRQVAEAFVCLDNGIPIEKFMQDKSLISEEEIQHTLDTILSPERFIMIDTENGNVSAKEIEALLEKAIDMGATKIIFDHFSYLADGNLSKHSKKDEIDSLLTAVNNLTKQHPIHVIGINHVTVDKTRGIVKDKDTGQTQYPFWYNCSRYDGAGSGGFTKLVDNMILIDVEFIGDEEVGRRRLKVPLNRRGITTGQCDFFTLDDKGRIVAI